MSVIHLTKIHLLITLLLKNRHLDDKIPTLFYMRFKKS